MKICWFGSETREGCVCCMCEFSLLFCYFFIILRWEIKNEFLLLLLHGQDQKGAFCVKFLGESNLKN